MRAVRGWALWLCILQMIVGRFGYMERIMGIGASGVVERLDTRNYINEGYFT